MSRILLGVTGSIAAYKAADLAHQLVKAGHTVDVVMTAAATQFVTPLTFRTLTGRPVSTPDDLLAATSDEVRHISLARDADLAIIAPATANIIGKLAAGLGDDYLTTVALALRGQPRLIAPAMNTAMLVQPVVRANLERLVNWGWEVIEPAEGLLACGETGRGALAPVADLVAAVTNHLGAA